MRGKLVVDSVDLRIGHNQIHAIVGESGSGKTTVALSMLGYVPAGLVHLRGGVEVVGEDITAATDAERGGLRGREITYVPQEAATALDPRARVGRVLERMRLRHRDRNAPPAEELLDLVDLPTDAEFCARYPHQLSGGQQQRLAIAAALAPSPSVVVFDEPTTGLDAIVKKQLLATLHRLQRRVGFAAVFITHDLHAAERLADEVTVLLHGRVVESGPTLELFTRPQESYTRALLDALPTTESVGHSADPVDSRTGASELLAVSSLAARHGRGRAVNEVLHGVELEIARAERVAVVGESGSGKSTLARCVAGLHHDWSGTITLAGEELARDVRGRSGAQLQRLQLIFQNPASSLNPRRRVLDAVALGGQQLRGLAADHARAEATELLDSVGIDHSYHRRRPASLSGGQRQRVAIAQALIAQPDLLICDEITSALDVSVQAEVIELLRDLCEQRGMALLFITHDLGVVASIAERVVVVRHGSIVEDGLTAELFAEPKHPYTRELLDARRSSSAKSRHEPGDSSPYEGATR